MHYKSFEELYGKETTENHRPSLKNTKLKKKDKMKSSKHTMPFYPSAARAKNVGIIVNCVECEKPRLLFSAKKLTEKDKTTLRSFLDTIFFTCGMSFHNTCDLAIAVSPKRSDDDTDNTVNDDEEADDQEIMDMEDNDENERNESEDSDNEESDNDEEEEPKEKEAEKEEDSIREIFSRVFVNDSWSCASQVEKPYYSAGIFPDVCFECGSSNVTEVTTGEHPHCSICSGNTNISKKRLRWKQGGGSEKGKRKIG